MPDEVKTAGAADPGPAATAKAAVLNSGTPGQSKETAAGIAQTAAEVEARVKTEMQHPHLKPFTFSAVAGNVFSADGVGFGEHPGTVLVGGLPAPVTKWSDGQVKGSMPKGVTKGEVVIFTSAGERHAVWPQPAAATPGGRSVVDVAPGVIEVDGVRFRKEG